VDINASFVMVGASHHDAPLDLLEQLAVRPADLDAALTRLASCPDIDGVVILSTCNRTELYASCRRFHAGTEALVAFLADRAGLPADELIPHLRVLHDDTVLTHLFRVAAGVESMVIGEAEILGQLQRALAAAQSAGTACALLSRAFGHATRVGRRARADTGIGRETYSLPALAVKLALRQFETLAECRALVLGAGEMGSTVARVLAKEGTGHITILGRGTERAAAVAAEVGAEALGADRLAEALRTADLVVTATSSSQRVLRRELCAAALADRPQRPLLIVDLGLPHDVDPDVATVDAVTLIDLADLRAAAADSLSARRSHLPEVERIVADEVQRFLRDTAARDVAPLVSALRCHVEEVRRAELRRWQTRFGPLDENALSLVEAVTAGVVAKLLHGPTVRLKESADDAQAQLYRDALTALFDLPA